MKNSQKMPKFEIEDLEDAYTYYVIMMGINEEIFWYSNIGFTRSILENKLAYENWRNFVQNEANK